MAMVLYVTKWNILPDKTEAYDEWTGSAIRRVLWVPGVVELRAYRPATGPFQVAVTHEFADLAGWVAWYSHRDVQEVIQEARTLTTGMRGELWCPSPIVPEPIRPRR